MKIYSALTLPFLSHLLVGAWKDLTKKEQTIWGQIENKVKDLMDFVFKGYDQIIELKEPVPIIPCFCKFAFCFSN